MNDSQDTHQTVRTPPYGTARHQALLNLLRAAASVSDTMEDILKPHGLSAPQYNVLRILRGAGGDGLCRNEVRDRMLTRMPDMTRLLDRMEEAGLVTRSRGAADRRVVTTRLTEAGESLVTELDGPVARVHESRLGHLTDEQVQTLNELVILIRNTTEE